MLLVEAVRNAIFIVGTFEHQKEKCHLYFNRTERSSRFYRPLLFFNSSFEFEGSTWNVHGHKPIYMKCVHPSGIKYRFELFYEDEIATDWQITPYNEYRDYNYTEEDLCGIKAVLREKGAIIEVSKM